MYYELCGMLSRSLGKKNVILLCGIMFIFCVRYGNIRFMNVCMQFYIYYHPVCIKHGKILTET